MVATGTSTLHVNIHKKIENTVFSENKIFLVFNFVTAVYIDTV